MPWLPQRIINRLMEGFVGSGVGIDDEGRLCLPDDLTPGRVHRFIELCVATRYPNPKAAMHDLFAKVGVHRSAIDVLDRIIGESGNIEMSSLPRHTASLLASLADLRSIPQRFQHFLVEDLAIADGDSADLPSAVVSARQNVAARVPCEADWDTILTHPEAVGAIAEPWRSRL